VKIALVERIQEPLIPTNRPKPQHEIKLKKGKTKMQKYIKIKKFTTSMLIIVVKKIANKSTMQKCFKRLIN